MALRFLLECFRKRRAFFQSQEDIMPKWMNEVSEEDRICLSKVCDNLRKISEEQRKLLDNLAKKYCKFKIGCDVYNIASRSKLGTVSNVFHPEGEYADSFYETGEFNPQPEINAAIDIDCFGGGTMRFTSQAATNLCTKEELIHILDIDLKCLRSDLIQLKNK